VQSKKKLFIIGAGSFGRELESWLHFIPKQERDWELIGYLDSVQEKGKLPYPSDYEILGNENEYPLTKNDYVLISIANTLIREQIYNKLKGKVSFFTFISPKATIGKFNNIGEGCVICPNVVLTTNINLGKGTIVNIGSQIGHDVNIGSFSSLMANVDIAGKCIIGERVFMGSNSIIIPEKKVCSDSKVGAGSVVIRNVRPNTTVFGNPAKKIK